jgi:hypothetical protein
MAGHDSRKNRRQYAVILDLYKPTRKQRFQGLETTTKTGRSIGFKSKCRL